MSRFESLFINNNNNNIKSTPNNISNLLNVENNNLLEYYKQNYFLTIQPFFLENIDRNLINMIHHIRVLNFFKIIEKRDKFQKKSELAFQQHENNRHNFYQYYYELCLKKLVLMSNIYQVNLYNINYIQSNNALKNFKRSIKNNSLEQRRLGLLEKGLCKSEFQMIDLIAQFATRKSFTHNNYENALNKYASFAYNENPRKNNQNQVIQKNNNKSVYKILKKHTYIPGVSVNFQENNFDLFSFSKKEYLEGTKCKYEFSERNINNKQNYLNTIRNLPVLSMDWNTILDLFGINQLDFITSKNTNNKIKNTLSKLLSLLTIPINQEDSKLLRTSIDNILYGISFILLNNNYKLENSNENLKKKKTLGEGAYGKVSLISNTKVEKNENLRYTLRELSLKKGKKTYYPLSSYMSSFTLLGFILQKFLYNLNNNYVPNIYDVKFDFESNKLLYNKNKNLNLKARTVMNLSGKNMINNNKKYISTNLYSILFENDYYLDTNFELFVFKIIYKLCEVLEFYQNKCMFVHRDLHVKNIMINLNYNLNGNKKNINTDDFELKLIDFSFSSIVLKNMSNKISYLTYMNYKPFKDPYISNPFFNKEWNQTDLRFFFLYLFVDCFVKFLDNNKMNILHKEKIKNILLTLIDVFNINTDYINKLKTINLNNFTEMKCRGSEKYTIKYIMFFKKNIHEYIFGNDFDYNCYIPSVLKEKMNNLINL